MTQSRRTFSSEVMRSEVILEAAARAGRAVRRLHGTATRRRKGHGKRRATVRRTLSSAANGSSHRSAENRYSRSDKHYSSRNGPPCPARACPFPRVSQSLAGFLDSASIGPGIPTAPVSALGRRLLPSVERSPGPLQLPRRTHARCPQDRNPGIETHPETPESH